MNADKPKLAMYWAAACGGCEITTLNIGEYLLTVDDAFEFVFFPCIADFKLADVRGYPDGTIDLCLFNGAINTTENEEMAELLRRKAKLLVAFGSCAHEGCIPALLNLTTTEAMLETVYGDNPSLDNPDGIVPLAKTEVPGGELGLPHLLPTVKALDQVVPVDYTIPGCPPESRRVRAVLELVIDAMQTGKPLPPKGSILGATNRAVCEECPLAREEKSITRFYRPQEKVPEPDRCLLDQGFLCMGPATRGGCDARCPGVGMGCRGCYGPLDGVADQGAKMLSALASVIGVGEASDDENALAAEIDAVTATLPDPSGTFYRFSMAHSLLGRARAHNRGGQS